MEATPLLIFFLVFIIGYLGTMPFGPINLSVIDTAISRNFRSAFFFSLAAALVEIPQSLVALRFGLSVSQWIEESWVAKTLAVLVFVGMGAMFFLKKPREEDKKSSDQGDFLHGFVIAVMNPQAIPFWVVVLAYLKTAQQLTLTTHMALPLILAFLLGVGFGKLFALLTYARLSQLIIARLSFVGLWMNKIIGSILIALGLLHGLRSVI
ncbi:MAG: LysE family transporter [Haliscomenobacter sp.]|nr:LysE family transporter [Haliscomenobacter sp.]MBP9077092.1 LysE family transporter [Haliscomenobacter sp.]MBP9873003.1 LysE family transporter [Haliscomenobacter sp.]